MAALRAYAAARGVRLLRRHADLRRARRRRPLAHPELFQQGFVAGVPPDSFAPTGQLWGNPLYDWTAMRARRLPLVDRALPPHASSSST